MQKHYYIDDEGNLVQKRDPIDAIPVCVYPTGVSPTQFRTYLRAFTLHPELEHTWFEHIHFERIRVQDAIRITANPHGFFDIPNAHAAALLITEEENT